MHKKFHLDVQDDAGSDSSESLKRYYAIHSNPTKTDSMTAVAEATRATAPLASVNTNIQNT